MYPRWLGHLTSMRGVPGMSHREEVGQTQRCVHVLTSFLSTPASLKTAPSSPHVDPPAWLCPLSSLHQLSQGPHRRHRYGNESYRNSDLGNLRKVGVVHTRLSTVCVQQVAQNLYPQSVF